MHPFTKHTITPTKRQTGRVVIAAKGDNPEHAYLFSSPLPPGGKSELIPVALKTELGQGTYNHRLVHFTGKVVGGRLVIGKWSRPLAGCMRQRSPK